MLEHIKSTGDNLSKHAYAVDGINYTDCIYRIKNAFNCEAWAYAVMYHGVAIGIWDGEDMIFHNSTGFNWDYVMELRVFNKEREMRLMRGENDVILLRDSDIYKNYNDIEIRDTAYKMYGTGIRDAGEKWFALSEDRGGDLYFPKTNVFSGDNNMWLGIRDYLIVTEDLRLEAIDFAFTGFKYGLEWEKPEVELTCQAIHL